LAKHYSTIAEKAKSSDTMQSSESIEQIIEGGEREEDKN